jgi:glutathionylspermidine synthase
VSFIDHYAQLHYHRVLVDMRERETAEMERIEKAMNEVYADMSVRLADEFQRLDELQQLAIRSANHDPGDEDGGR